MKEGTIKNCHQHTVLKIGLLFQGVSSMVGKSIQCDVNVTCFAVYKAQCYHNRNRRYLESRPWQMQSVSNAIETISFNKKAISK